MSGSTGRWVVRRGMRPLAANTRTQLITESCQYRDHLRDLSYSLARLPEDSLEYHRLFDAAELSWNRINEIRDRLLEDDRVRRRLAS